MTITPHVGDIYFWLILICLAGFYWIAWRSRFKALMILTVLLPSYIIRTTILTIPVTFLELMIVGLFAIWIIREKQYPWLLIRRGLPHINPIPLAYRLTITIILLAATISIFIGSDLWASLGIWKAYFLEPIMLFLIVMHTVRLPQQIYDLLDSLGLLVLLLFPLALYQQLTGHSIPEPFWAAAATRRITTVFGYPNANGLLLAPIIALYAGYLLKRESLVKTIYKLAVIITGCLIIFWSHTDGAMVALILTAIYLVGKILPRKKWYWLGLILVALGTIYFFLSSQQWQTQWHRISTNTLALTSSSLEIRINQWRETLVLLKTQPILGSGLVGYQTALEPFHANPFLEIFLYPHNILLNFWVELGLLGLLGFLWLGWLLVQSLRTKKADPWLSTLLTAAWLTLIIHGLVDVPYFKNDLSVLFWLLVAFTLINANFQASTPSTDN
jgi:O-antigen ligase